MSQFCISSLFCIHSVTIRCYALVWRKLKPDSAIPGTITGSCTLWSSPSTLYNFAKYLMLDDGGCLNSILLVDFIPLNSDHLFWDRNLESFWVPWDLQSLVAGSLAIDSFLGIHQCPLIDGSFQVFDLNTTSTHLFTLVSLHSSTLIPIFIIGGWSRFC